MTYSKDQLKKWSGGTKARTTYKVPTLKFNGNTGKLMKFAVGDYKNGTEVTDVELVIMRPRRVFTSFEKTTEGAIRLFTNEHNTWGDHLTVFEARANQNIKVIGSGSIESLRNEFPALRINSNLYCLYDNEVYKLVVKGKSRQSLVTKQKKLTDSGLELFEKRVKLVPTQEQGNAGNIYYFLNYEEVGESDLDIVGPHMETIAKVMDKMDEEYKETNDRMANEAKTLNSEVAVEEDIIPMESTKEKKDDSELAIDEIPF